MFLEHIDIKYFRGIRDLSLDLDRTTVLIGENNTGKSTVLDAIQIALGGFREKNKRQVGEYDHYLTQDNRVEESEPIEITLRFAERQDDRWHDALLTIAREAIQTNMDDSRVIIARVKATYNAKEGRSDVEWSFINLIGDTLSPNSGQSKYILQTLVQSFALYSMRDLNQELKPSSKFWGSFVRSVSMESEKSKKFESQLINLNREIIQSQESLNEIGKQLSKISRFIHFDSDEPVSIDALPTKISEILSKSQVSLSSATGAKIPIWRHGEGTQSLALIHLLMAYLGINLINEMKEPTFVLTVEEPEAHLHPSASSSIIKMLSSVHHGQSVIATHSGDMLTNVDITSVRRLHRVDGEIRAYKIDPSTLDLQEKRLVEHHIKTTRGNLLFARCWLLVEGESDYAVLDGCASACGLDLICEGVYCIEYAQSPGSTTAWIKIAHQLGIECILTADGDKEGDKYIANAKKYLECIGKSNNYMDEHIYQLDHVLEIQLCISGYGSFYTGDNAYDPSQNHDASYWNGAIGKMSSKKKNLIALEVSSKIKENGISCVPTLLREIVNKATDLSRRPH